MKDEKENETYARRSRGFDPGDLKEDDELSKYFADIDEPRDLHRVKIGGLDDTHKSRKRGDRKPPSIEELARSEIENSNRFDPKDAKDEGRDLTPHQAKRKVAQKVGERIREMREKEAQEKLSKSRVGSGQVRKKEEKGNSDSLDDSTVSSNLQNSEKDLNSRWKVVTTKRKGWSNADIKYLKENPDIPVKELAKHLGRSRGSIRTKRYMLGDEGASDKKLNTEWTDKDIQYLKDNQHLPNRELAKNLNRSVGSIGMQLARIRGSVLDKVWDNKEMSRIQKFLKNNWTDEEIGDEMGINANTVKNKRLELGLIRFNDPKLSGSELALDPRNVTDFDKSVIKGYFEELKGFKILGQELNRSTYTLKTIVRETGVTSVNSGYWQSFISHFKGDFDQRIPEYLKEIIRGMLLGDVQIFKSIQKINLIHLRTVSRNTKGLDAI